MKKNILSILMSLISLMGYSRFSANLNSENGFAPSNRSTDVKVGSASNTFLGPIANGQCATPYNVPVNATDECLQVQNASFIGSTVSTEGGTNKDSNSGDIWFQFKATSTAQIIDLLNFKGTPHPITLKLYQGQCGSLNQLYCSSNNSITATGLQIGTSYLIRASINTVTTDLNVQFDLCVKAPQAPADGTSVNCLINTVNSDFEIPAIVSVPSFPNDNTMLGWRTTATDHIIELWRAPNYEKVPAYSGAQFIELNAYQASGVYQDYSTPVTTVFNYGFAHRGRQGSDVCGLYAGPPDGPFTLIYTATTGKTAWSYNTGSYTVPPGQTVTRFMFKAISSVGGATIGNFLDSINFTANNSIISPSPLNLDCMATSTNVLAAGQGTWSAHSSNPIPTIIGNPTSNATTISGFTVSGTYKYDWTTLYCTSTLEIYINKGGKVPVFTQVPPVCYSENLPSLPTTSDNIISGTWSPTLNNTETTTYTFTPEPEECAVTTTMTITVNDLPEIAADYNKIICSGNKETAILDGGVQDGSQSDYSYEWYVGGELISSAEAHDLPVTSDGVYTCNIKNKGTGCQNTRTITVDYSEAVEIKKIIISDLTDNNTVTVMVLGDAEYSLDNATGPFQDSNVFENIKPGIHTVYVNDKKGCGVIEKTIAVIGAPLFFTPNGDGYNEHWKIQGVNAEYFKNTRVDIFDRYGKLIKVLPDAESEGWDGTYNGNPQPSDDYWFVVEIEDGRVAKGHFALKR